MPITGDFFKKEPGLVAAIKVIARLNSKIREVRDLIIFAESAPKDGTAPVNIDSVDYSEIGMFVMRCNAFRCGFL